MKSHLVIYAIVFLLTESNACPSECVCKWKGGKQTVNCANKDLLTIPYGMDAGTQVLDFSGNNLRALQSKRFFKLELVNLQRLYLSKCHISSIDDRAFVGLTNLVELDLSQNMIGAIPHVTFVDYPQLMRLSLNMNPIKVVPSFAFHDLSFLMTLELSDCEIERVDDDAFAGVNNLEWLKLDGNRLEFIKGTDVLPKSLHGIELHRNRWNCDCRLLDMHTWLRNFKVPITVEPTCSKPSRLQKRTIKSVNVTDLACLPDISPTTLYLEISEGKNISLLCRVHAIPEAHVSWWFQGQLLQNDTNIAPGYHLVYYIEEGAVEKKSELFIYNTNTDDNGTFICAAENPAGTSLSNYTIRVVVKGEPIIVVVPFPLEYFVAIITAVTLLVIFIVICLVIIALRCRSTHKVRKKKNDGKDAILSLRDDRDRCSKASTINDSVMDDFKSNQNLFQNSSASVTIDNLSTMGAKFTSVPCENPDLISDADKNYRQTSDEDQELANPYKQAMSSVIRELETSRPAFKWSDNHILVSCKPLRCEDFYQHAADIHLNPGCFVTDERCLSDAVSYQGGKKMNIYRTLPHRPKMAVSTTRFTRDAEYMSVNPNSMAYEFNDVRYTAEGYPCPLRTEPCLVKQGSENQITWPSCLPGDGLPLVDVSSLERLEPLDGGSMRPAKRKCVGAQTDEGAQGQTPGSSDVHKLVNKPTSDLLTQHVQEVLTESPDEGYEGDNNDNVDM